MDSFYVIFYSSPFLAESNQGSDCTKQQIWIWLSAMIRGQREHDTTAPAKAPGWAALHMGSNYRSQIAIL